MIDSFFSRRLHWFFALLTLLFVVFWKWKFVFSCLFFYFSFLFLFRRRKTVKLQLNSPTTPAGGKVLKVSEHSLSIRMTWYSGFGCYLPCSGEIVENSSNSFSLRDFEGDLWRVELYPGIWGALPHLFILAGDTGLRGGNVGFIPWGGELILYLPKKYEILVHEHDVLEAGITLLAKKAETT